MKSLTLIFHGDNGAAAKALADKVRAGGTSAQLRSAVAYGGEVEPCDVVVVQSDVSAFDRARIEAAYGDKVQRSEKPKLTLPPAPAAVPAPPPVAKGK